MCKIQKVFKFTHFSQKNYPHQWGYKFVNIHIYYHNCANIHYYCSCVNNFLIFFLSPIHQTSHFLFSPKSFLSRSPSPSLLTLPLNNTKSVNHPPLSTHHTQAKKSHLPQTPKPKSKHKSNYTHNSEHQKPNKITKSPNPREIQS